MARSPARFLAPLALVAFGVALFLLLSTALKDDPGDLEQRLADVRAAGRQGRQGRRRARRRRRRRRYTVKAGDTPSGIAEKVDVPLTTILQLNPDLDPQVLTPGQELKLR